MRDKLNEIIDWKRQEIAPRIRTVSSAELARAGAATPLPPSFSGALRRPDGSLGVIAEIKRRSPSAGDIRPAVSAVEQAGTYRAAGADAISVLTDARYFGGALEDLESVTAHLGSAPPRRPCLRKDFIVHPIQILEARLAGASAILIIVRALEDSEIRILRDAARASGLEALFEVHDEPELERAIAHGASMIGVNNRDLAVFRTDLAVSERLIPRIPREILVVSESGIFSTADARRARAAGAHAVLVGEALMKSSDPEALIASIHNV